MNSRTHTIVSVLLKYMYPLLHRAKLHALNVHIDKVTDTRARAVRNVLGNLYLSSLTKNLWYEEREQLDSGGGGTLSQGAGHDGSFF